MMGFERVVARFATENDGFATRNARFAMENARFAT